MAQHDERAYLFDILDCAKTVRDYVASTTFDVLMTERLTRSGVLREIEIMGEAARYVSAETRVKLPQIAWTSLIGMRNILIHGYRSIDFDEVRNAVTFDLPILIEAIEAYLKDAVDAPSGTDEPPTPAE